MDCFVTGATGFVGRSLCLTLAREGHRVTAWVRDRAGARAVLGSDVELIETSASSERLRQVLEGTDVVFNLAGAPVAQRWTRRARSEMVASRVGLTQRLVEAMRGLSRRPRTLISASAVGIYGDRGDEVLSESSSARKGFLGDLSHRWEAAALEAESLGVRVVCLRIGVVLGRDGGALATMERPFRAGLGAALGSGRQYFPFIHLDDLLDLMLWSSAQQSLRGPLNAVAPASTTNAEFSDALAAVLGRPRLFRAPSWLLRLGLGRQARIVLDSQRVSSDRAESLGFVFRHPTVESTLEDLYRGRDIRIEPAAAPPDDAAYLRDRPATHRLETDVLIDAPLADVFNFFQSAENLGAMTPPDMAFRIRTQTPIDMRAGQTIQYDIQLGPIPLRWETSITKWQPGAKTAVFVDAQERGPYASWYHEHIFEDVAGKTRMIDRVWYALPLGPLGALAHALYVRRKLEAIFRFRRDAIERRFGLALTRLHVAA